jgi:hypothetical protein
MSLRVLLWGALLLVTGIALGILSGLAHERVGVALASALAFCGTFLLGYYYTFRRPR